MEGIWLVSYLVLWLVVLVLLVLVILLYRQLGIMYLGSAEGVSRDGLDLGAQAPDFALTDHYGNLQRSADYRGRPLLLLFGSPTCGPCKVLLPELHSWAADHPEVGVVWLNLASPEENLRYASEMGATLPMSAHTPADGVVERFKVRVTPFLFFLDEQGIVRAKGLANTRDALDMYYKQLTSSGAEGLTVQQAG
ncbi:MAG: redoxin domain-containing protein [Chloroflexota bacterium]|nr:redoxin domain-containing protein [Chloroflexota bacterium]MDQ5866783.1 redoxin domain-containing protein [Chloroflexota bacterium]